MDVVTESALPESENLDQMSVQELLRLMAREDQRAVEAVQRATAHLATVVGWAADAIRQGHRLFYVGAGTSGRLGVLDAAECPPTFSVPAEWVQGIIAGGDAALKTAVEGAEDNREQGAIDLASRQVGPGDVVVGIAASGTTPYVWGALAGARQAGARTALITCNRLTEPPADAELIIELIVGPEVLSGSTRLKAGTATKLALNQISTATMVQLGKVYGHWMVDVKASNQKLRRRALNLVMRLAKVDEIVAQNLLTHAEWEVKTAIAMHWQQTDAETARTLLKQAGGFLRALEPSP